MHASLVEAARGRADCFEQSPVFSCLRAAVTSSQHVVIIAILSYQAASRRTFGRQGRTCLSVPSGASPTLEATSCRCSCTRRYCTAIMGSGSRPPNARISDYCTSSSFPHRLHLLLTSQRCTRRVTVKPQQRGFLAPRPGESEEKERDRSPDPQLGRLAAGIRSAEGLLSLKTGEPPMYPLPRRFASWSRRSHVGQSLGEDKSKLFHRECCQ